MPRMDEGLAFMLQYENVADYNEGVVTILDRRIYPGEVTYVTCQDYHQVAQAITDMVTQSGGPHIAALQAMVMTAYQVEDKDKKEAKAVLSDAVNTLANARPTTSEGMVGILQQVYDHACGVMDSGGSLGSSVQEYVLEHINQVYRRSRSIAEQVVSLLPANPTIITQCFAETLIGFILLVCKETGKDVKLICPETRPYLQGARLTASVAYDMGIDVTVVTDNMPGYLISQGIPDAFICAADVITLDGHVVNKIGTFQIALASHFYNIPFYVLGTPEARNPTIDTVKIEERNSEEVLYAMGVRTTMEGVKGFYPAFDITPPQLVSAVITEKGIFSPYDLVRHFKLEQE